MNKFKLRPYNSKPEVYAEHTGVSMNKKTYSRVSTCIYNLHTQSFSKSYRPNPFHRFRLIERHTQPVTRYDLSCMKPML